MTWPARVWCAISDIFTGVPTDAADRAPSTASPASAPGPDDSFAARLSTELLRHPVRLAAACLATVLGPAVVAQAGSAGPSPGAADQRAGEVIAAEAGLVPPAPGDTVGWQLVAQAAADTCPGLPASVLVAIGRAESSLGLDLGPSSAGARGPMQFLAATWVAYGADGDGDGRADPMNAADALHGAARLLCAYGGGNADRLRSALWNYNHSDDYVERVLTLADVASG